MTGGYSLNPSGNKKHKNDKWLPVRLGWEMKNPVWVLSQWLGTRGSVKTSKPQRKRSDFDVVLRLFTNRTLWIPLNSVYTVSTGHVDCNVTTLNCLRFWNTSGVTGCQTVLQSYVSRVFAINISKKNSPAAGCLSTIFVRDLTLKYNLWPDRGSPPPYSHFLYQNPKVQSLRRFQWPYFS
jgi:hypothetical protein